MRIHSTYCLFTHAYITHAINSTRPTVAPTETPIITTKVSCKCIITLIKISL